MKKLKYLFLISILSGCATDLENSNHILPSEKLKLFSTKQLLSADAKDTLHLLCRIPLEAGRLDIVLTTTHGLFVQTEAKTIKEFADSISGQYRYATTVLRSDSSKTTVYITAETGNTRTRIPITFN